MLTRSVRRAICLSLVVGLTWGPCPATGGQQAIGQIISSSGASVGGVPVPGSGTVLPGDTLSTAKGGTALVRISASTQVSLAEGTTVNFTNPSGHPVARISSGIFLAETDQSDSLSIETPRCRIAPAQPGKATYLVSVSPDGSSTITARHGAALVTEISSGRSNTLPEGETEACAAPSSPVLEQEREEAQPAPSEPAGQAAPHPSATHHGSSGLLILVAVGAAAGVAVAVAAGGGGGGGGRGPASPSAP
jgi:hypothetical protein